MAFNYIKKYLTKEDLIEIQEEIAKIEKTTSGEIRLCLKLKKGFHERKYSNREIGIKEFFKLGMDKTEDGTGVLIFILFKDRVFEIIADENINSKISPEKWEIISGHLKNEFSQGNYKTGLINCLNEIKKIMEIEFPVKENDKNEISNEIAIE